jgi:hypothetical protein
VTETVDAADAAVGDRPGAPGSILRRALPVAIGVLLAFLLVEVLFEAWVQELLGPRHIDANGNLVVDLPAWPKQVKNAVYLTLLGLAGVLVAVERRWREFTTKADLALLVLALVMVVSGLLNDSSPILIGKALYVYFRGVIVMVALRAWKPPWLRTQMIVWLVGVVVVINALVGLIQVVTGPDGYRNLGWTDLTWANINRAQGLLDHPNNLGHVTGIALLGVVAWFVSVPKVSRLWWLLFVVLALGLAVSQSRESIVGVVVGVVAIAVMRRGRARTLIGLVAVVAACAALPLVLSVENRAELERRWGGVTAAIETPSGQEQTAPPSPTAPAPASPGPQQPPPTPPAREIRLLFAQQGFRLWQEKPLLGYGVGQFGGIVAYEDDPNWNLDPRFGPGGFDLHGFYVKQVDSFWLHLVVETGALGFVAYLVWMCLLAAPAVRAARRMTGNGDRALERTRTFAYWVPAALVFGAAVAWLSPALEDPLFPALLFAVVGFGWVHIRTGEPAMTEPSDT